MASKDLKQREPYFLKRNVRGASMEASWDNTVQLDRQSFLKNRAWRRGGGQAGWTLPTPHWMCPSTDSETFPPPGVPIFSACTFFWYFLPLISCETHLGGKRWSLYVGCHHFQTNLIPGFQGHLPSRKRVELQNNTVSLNFGKNRDLTCCWLASMQPSQQDPTGQGHKGQTTRQTAWAFISANAGQSIEELLSWGHSLMMMMLIVKYM